MPGKINAYRLGRFGSRRLGALGDCNGKPLVIEGLWALAVGPDQRLYFTAGPGGEKHGLFGRLDPARAY